MPYAICSDAIMRVTRGPGVVGVIVPFDWPQRDGIDQYKGAAGLVLRPSPMPFA